MVLNVLKGVKSPTFEKITKQIKISELRNRMPIAEDIRGKNGMLLVAKNQEVSGLLRKRLENSNSQGDIEDAARVYVSRQ